MSEWAKKGFMVPDNVIWETDLMQGEYAERVGMSAFYAQIALETGVNLFEIDLDQIRKEQPETLERAERQRDVAYHRAGWAYIAGDVESESGDTYEELLPEHNRACGLTD